MEPIGVIEAIRLAFDWARENHIGPLQTFLFVTGVFGLFLFSRFVRGAKKIVMDTHHVYEQSLAHQNRDISELRAENDRLRGQRHALLDELEDERTLKAALLRSLSKLRAEHETPPPPEE